MTTQSTLSKGHIPRVHDEVVTLMDEPLGHVVAVFDDMFKVATDGGHYYAPFDCVFKRSSGRVTLICDQAGVSRYFFDWP